MAKTFDPNHAYEEITRHLGNSHMLIVEGYAVFSDDIQAAWRLFGELDEWLSKGGYPPAAWGPFSKAPESK